MRPRGPEPSLGELLHQLIQPCIVRARASVGLGDRHARVAQAPGPDLGVPPLVAGDQCRNASARRGSFSIRASASYSTIASRSSLRLARLTACSGEVTKPS